MTPDFAWKLSAETAFAKAILPRPPSAETDIRNSQRGPEERSPVPPENHDTHFTKGTNTYDNDNHRSQ